MALKFSFGRGLPRLSYTQILLVGLSVGYVGFVAWLGLRLMVLVSGGAIALTALLIWYTQPQKTDNVNNPHDLLQPEIFLTQINGLGNLIPVTYQTPLYQQHWDYAQAQSQAIHQIVIAIAQQESTFIPDLLDALHTVLDLVAQLVQALKVTQQVQTPQYQDLAQQQLDTSVTRLRQTHDQLQALHDQMAVESLDRRLSHPARLTNRLQLLIAANRNGILKD
ncbi:MAG: hypothetical protein AAFV72_16905 [Cyanobacteria bacterium J06635_1]